MKAAAALCSHGRRVDAVNGVWAHYQKDPALARVLEAAGGDRATLSRIVVSMELSGAGVSLRGHYVPVSALFFADTLTYCLRSLAGQVDPAHCARELMCYFASGAIDFSPERSVRTGKTESSRFAATP